MTNTRRYILICDDSVDTIDLLKFVLEENDYQVEAAQSVFEAIAKLKESTPNLLITDLMLPDCSGFALINHVRQQLQLNNLPILAISAAFHEDFQADDNLFFIEKPLDLDFLTVTIDKILS
jgi:CheY-like chemotaxis protein